jgi:predicted aspartyl protease
MIPVTFSSKNLEFSTFALVDSGASMSVISTVIAEELGIDWINVPVKTGLAVASTVRYHTVGITAEIFGHTFDLAVNVAEGLAPYHCILGQADLFQRAKIIFEAYKKEFSIDFRKFN